MQLKILLKIACISLIFSWIVTDSFGQLQYSTRTYDVRDGIKGMQCMNVFEDKDGFIWVATKSGISRFDGSVFRNFGKNDSFPVARHFGGICQLPNGTIYVSADHQLYAYDGKYFKKIKIPLTFNTNSNRSLFTYDEQSILILSHKNGDDSIQEWWHYDVSKNKIKLLKFPTYAGQNFFPHFYDVKHKLWIGKLGLSVDRGHIGILSENKFQVIKGNYLSLEYYNNVGFPIIRGLDLENKEVFYYASKPLEYKLWMTINTENGQSDFKFTLPHDQVINSNNHIGVIFKNSKNFHFLKDDINIGSHTIKTKNDNSFWISTEKGLIYFPNNGFSNFKESDAPYTWNVVEDKNNGYLFCNFDADLTYYKAGRITKFPDYKIVFNLTFKKDPAFDPNNALRFYYSGFTDKHGNTWLPNGASLVKFNQGKFQIVNKYNSYNLLYDKEHDLIFQGSSKKIIVSSASNLSVKLILESDKDLLSYPHYMQLFKDSKGQYWLGGFGGMNKFKSYKDLLNKKSKEYSLIKGNIPFKSFITMAEDSKGTIWVGTNIGLYYYDDKLDTFRRAMTDYENEPVVMIGQLDNNKMFVGGETNLYVIDINKIRTDANPVLKVFNHLNGFNGLEPGQNGFMKDSKGQIWITSGTVLSVLDPKKLDLNSTKLKPYVESINGQNIAFVGNPTLNIPDRKNDLVLKVGTIGFNIPTFQKYAYKLDKTDKWSDWQTSNELSINNLINGKHTIYIRTKTNGLDDNKSASVKLNIYVNAKFYNSPNFYKYALLSALALVLVLAYFLRKSFFTNKVLKQNKSTINFLTLQTLQSQLNPHFLFNALSSLQGLILKKETYKANESLEKISTLMRNYLDATRSAEKHSLITLKTKLNILESYISLEQSDANEKFRYTIKVDPALDIDQTKLPPLIIQPFVENAIKHGLKHKKEGGFLLVEFSREHNTLLCIIDDDGVGRTQAAQLKTRSEHSYKSHGTDIVHERVKLLNSIGYHIEIKTIDKPQGTQVIIKINVPDEY